MAVLRRKFAFNLHTERKHSLNTYHTLVVFFIWFEIPDTLGVSGPPPSTRNKEQRISHFYLEDKQLKGAQTLQKQRTYIFFRPKYLCQNPSIAPCQLGTVKLHFSTGNCQGSVYCMTDNAFKAYVFSDS